MRLMLYSVLIAGSFGVAGARSNGHIFIYTFAAKEAGCQVYFVGYSSLLISRWGVYA
jgi:hypothetical protein